MNPPRSGGTRTVDGPASQLHMVLSLETWPGIRAAEVPEGYALRTFRVGDEEAWVALMRHAGFESWSRDTLRQALSQAPPDGVFFIEHQPSGDLAATAMAGHKPTDLHLGYVPLLFAPGMEERWRVVARDLGKRFEEFAARR